MSSREQQHFSKFRKQIVQMLDQHLSDQDGLLTKSVLIRRCWQFAVLDSMFSTLTLSRSIRTAWSPRPSSARRYLHFHSQFWIRCSMATFVLEAISHNRSGLFCGYYRLGAIFEIDQDGLITQAELRSTVMASQLSFAVLESMFSSLRFRS